VRRAVGNKYGKCCWWEEEDAVEGDNPYSIVLARGKSLVGGAYPIIGSGVGEDIERACHPGIKLQT
jgi:hypothetical protein